MRYIYRKMNSYDSMTRAEIAIYINQWFKSVGKFGINQQMVLKKSVPLRSLPHTIHKNYSR